MTRGRGVTFPAWRENGFIPLIEVLQALGPAVLDRRWTISDAEFGAGRRGSDELRRLAATGQEISTAQLIDLVSDGVQLVDGDAIGLDVEGVRPVLAVRSIRGDAWDVEIDDQTVLAVVRRAFSNVTDLPFE